MWFASSECMGSTGSTSDYDLILQQGEIIYPGFMAPLSGTTLWDIIRLAQGWLLYRCGSGGVEKEYGQGYVAGAD